MNINEFRVGNIVKVENAIGEIVTVVDNLYTYEVSIAGSVNTYGRLSIEPVSLNRTMLINCFGFDEEGALKIDIDSREFYFQEKGGHIILMDNKLQPLIHFWDLKTIHQLQNFYYKFTGTLLPFNLQNITNSNVVNSTAK